MISKSLSTSKKWNSLTDWFARSLYLMLIVHADDYGIVDGDPQEIKWKVLPGVKETAADFETALSSLEKVGLVYRYKHESHDLIEIISFDEHQQGLHKRTARAFPGYADTNNTARQMIDAYSEKDLETLTEERIKNGQLDLDDEVLSVERQKRIGNSYIDIIVYGKKRTLIIEVKRCPISNSAIDQVEGYLGVIRPGSSAAEGIVLGYGLAANLDIGAAKNKRIGIFTFSEDLSVGCVLPLDGVSVRYLTPNNVTECSKTFPLNIKEYKGIGIGTEGEGERGRGTQPVGCSPAPTDTELTGSTVPSPPDKPKRPPSTSNAKRTTFPPNQQDLEASCLSWASTHANGIDPRVEFERFADYHRGKGSLMADWQAAWRNWYRKAKEYADAAPTKRPRDNVPPMWHTLRKMYPNADTEEGGDEA